MRPRLTLAVMRRTAAQLRNDPRTIALLFCVPLGLLLLTYFIYDRQPATFDRIGPLLMGLFPFTMMFLVTSITMQRERSNGTLERLMASPIGKADVIAGYALTFTVVAFVQVVLVATLAFGILDVPNRGSLPLAVALTMIEATLGVALGLLTSAFASTEFQAVQFMPVVVLPQFLLAGLIVPTSDLPRALEEVADLMPLKYAFDGLQRITQQGEGLTHGAVFGDFAFVACAAVVAIALGALTLRRTAP
jgi:ABC-2 type transport system permease protein